MPLPVLFMENWSPDRHINSLVHSLGKILRSFCILHGFLIVIFIFCLFNKKIVF